MESGGSEPNYWPGFVDALSNVVLTLVFVLVVFVFALVMASNKVAKKMEEVTAVEKAQKEGQVQLDKALAELEQLRAQQAAAPQDAKGGAASGTDQISCVKFSKSDSDQRLIVGPNADYILITFTANAISITDETIKAVETFVAKSLAETQRGKFTIESSEDPNSLSPLLSRETQLGRILNTRNALLKAKVPTGNIIIRNTVPLQQEGTYNWVKIYATK